MGPGRTEKRVWEQSIKEASSVERQELYRLACESERIIATHLEKFIDAKRTFSEAEQNAAYLGISVSAGLLMGLAHPQTDEAKQAIEKAFIHGDILDNTAGMDECLRTFGEVSAHSALPKLVANEISRFGDRDPDEYDPLPSRLAFFSGCSPAQIAEFLEPLSTTHTHEVTRQRIQTWLAELAPRIPFERFSEELVALSRQDSFAYDDFQRSVYLMQTLSRSEISRESLCSLIQTALCNIVTAKDVSPPNYRAWTIEPMLKALHELGSNSKAILEIAHSQVRKGCHSDVEGTCEYLKYIKRCEPAAFETTLRDFLRARTGSPAGRSQHYFTEALALSLLDTPPQPETLVVLGQALKNGYLLKHHSESVVAGCIARAPYAEQKGEIVADFQSSVEQRLAQQFSLTEDNFEDLRYRSLSDYHQTTAVAETLARGGFSGDECLEVLVARLSQDLSHASAAQIYAARLISGHESPAAEMALLDALERAKEFDFKMVVAGSLSHCRKETTRELLQMLWSDDAQEATVAARSFRGTTDIQEVRALTLVFKAAHKKAQQGDSAAASLCNTILETLLETPGDSVDEVYCAAITAGGEVGKKALFRCFPDQKHHRVRYRPNELLLGLSKRILDLPTVPVSIKERVLPALWPHVHRKDLQVFLSEQVRKEIDDKLSIQYHVILAASLQPESIRVLLHYIDFRYQDPANRPSLDIEEWIRHRPIFFSGDTRELQVAMLGFAGRKEGVAREQNLRE